MTKKQLTSVQKMSIFVSYLQTNILVLRTFEKTNNTNFVKDEYTRPPYFWNSRSDKYSRLP